MDQEKLGKYISDKRKELKKTQEDIAKILGIKKQSISKWENGQACPDIAFLIPLADELKVSVDALLKQDYSYNKRINYRKIILVIMIIISFIANTLITRHLTDNLNKLHVINYQSDNKDYSIEGNMIYNRDTFILDIESIEFNDTTIGTVDEEKIKDLFIEIRFNGSLLYEIYYDNNSIDDITSESGYLSDALTNVNISTNNIFDQEISITPIEKNKLELILKYHNQNNRLKTVSVLLNS